MFGTPQYSATGFSDGNFNVNGAISLTGKAITSAVASFTPSWAGNITVTTAGAITSGLSSVTVAGGAGITVTTAGAITSGVASVTLTGAGNITVTTAGVVTSATNNVTPGGGAGVSVDGLLITAGEGGIAGFFTTDPTVPN